MKLFNVIMTRVGLTLIITVAFSISTMLYSLAGSSPFFMIMFLQIVTFAGIYFKLGDIMNMFALQSNDSQGMGRQMFHKPRMFLNRQSRRLQRNVSRAIGKGSRSAKEKEAPAPTKTTKAPQTSTPKATPERTATTANQQHERPLQKQKNIPKEQVKTNKRENTSTTSKNSKTENKNTKTTTKRREQ